MDRMKIRIRMYRAMMEANECAELEDDYFEPYID